MILGLKQSEIKKVFSQLWIRKSCELPYTLREFSEWCEEGMPEDTRAYVLLKKGGPVGGILFYPVMLPKALFVQLIIALEVGVGRILIQAVLSEAKRLHLRYVTGIVRSEAMNRLFGSKEFGKFLILEA